MRRGEEEETESPPPISIQNTRQERQERHK